MQYRPIGEKQEAAHATPVYAGGMRSPTAFGLRLSDLGVFHRPRTNRRDNAALHASGRSVENCGHPWPQADLPCKVLAHGDHGSACVYHKCHRMPVDRPLNVEVLVMRSLDYD